MINNKKLLLVVSGLIFWCLIFQSTSRNSILLFFVWIPLFLVCLIEKREHHCSYKQAGLICMLVPMIACFSNVWKHSSKVQRIADACGITSGVLLTICGLGLACLSVPFLNALFCSIKEASLIQDNDERERDYSWKSILVISCIGVITILVFSRSSPLYPLNDWVDTNCFLTVSKSMLSGKVLYRDVYDQKGPFLFFICMIPALISNTSFLGFYFLEVIACIVFYGLAIG